MHKSRSFAALGILSCGLLLFCLLLTGCDRTEQITAGAFPSHQSLQTAAFQAEYERSHPKPNRMIAVVIPQPDFQWFFKLEGEPNAVAARENEIREFLKSVRFVSPEEIDWTLPAGWQKLPGNPMRQATILLDGQPKLEMSVTKLPTHPETPPIEQVVSNINRWRNQLSLPHIDEEDLATQSEKLTLNGFVGYWINIVGRPKPRPAGMNAKPRQATAADEKPAEMNNPAYEKPQGWTEGRPNGIAVVSLQASDGDAKVTVTVTSAGGSRLDNINRWRGQLKLDPIGEEELERSAKKVDVGPLTGDKFELSNDESAIFGAIVTVQGRTWFIKLMGDKNLAERERSRFEAFLKSLQWK